ncbi:hypothetical protein FGIG_07864, partial [Fasciola gigantica]
ESIISLSAPDLERYSRDADNPEEIIQSYRERIRMLEKELIRKALGKDNIKAVNLPHRDIKLEPYVICRAFIDNLMDGPVIKSIDSATSAKLAGQMKDCHHRPHQLNHLSDLSASRTIGAIVRHIPQPLQSRCSEVASSIMCQGREAIFINLAQFEDE